LFFCCSWVVYWASVVRAYGESGSYALTVGNDCGLSGCTGRGWLGVRVLDYDLDLAEVPALDGPGPLLSWVPPAVLDLDKLRARCNLAVDVSRELDLVARSREALCGIRATGKYFLLARHSRASHLRLGHQGEKAYITAPDDWLDYS
jgi:hypothetical protein